MQQTRDNFFYYGPRPCKKTCCYGEGCRFFKVFYGLEMIQQRCVALCFEIQIVNIISLNQQLMFIRC